MNATAPLLLIVKMVEVEQNVSLQTRQVGVGIAFSW